MAAGGSRTIKIRVDGDSSGLSRMADDGEKTLSRWGSRFASFGKAVALGVAAAGAALAVLGKASVQAFVESETAQARLTDAYARFPKTANLAIESLREYNTQLAKKVRFDDDALATGQATLAQFGLTGQQLKAVTPLLADFAVKTGRDLPTAAEVLGKSFLGNTKALKELGISYKSTGNQAKDVANITELLRKQVGGFAEKEGLTAAGRAEILKNQLGEVQEQIGAFLLPVLMTLGNWLLETGIPALQRFAEWFQLHILPAIQAIWQWLQVNLFPVLGTLASILTSTVIPALIGVVTWLKENWSWLSVVVAMVGTAIVTWTLYTSVTKGWAAATTAAAAAQAALNLAMRANVVGIIITIIAALVAGIIILWNKSEGFRNFFIGAWENIKTAIGIVVSWIVEKWDGLVAGFRSMVAIFQGIGDQIGNALSSGFKGAINGIISLLNGLISGLNFIIGGINAISPFNDIPKIPSIPKLARGGEVARGGLAVVGERGRELVSLPGGARVTPHRQTEDVLSGGGAPTVRVFIGERELTDLVRVEVEQENRRVARDLLAGVGGGR